jgi:hypothetical protein
MKEICLIFLDIKKLLFVVVVFGTISGSVVVQFPFAAGLRLDWAIEW